MIAIHKAHQELKTGSVKSLDKDYNFMAYGRFDRQGACVVVINNREETITKKISVWELGIPMEASLTRIMLTTEEGFTTEEVPIEAVGGRITVELPRTSAMVLKYNE